MARGKRSYYATGAALGIALAALLAAGLMGRAFFELFTDWKIALALLFGAFTAFSNARLIDRKRGAEAPTALGTLKIGVLVFLTGVFSGALLNLCLSGSVLSPSFGLAEEIIDWFVKPVYWLCVIGVPAALLWGVVYFHASRAFHR